MGILTVQIAPGGVRGKEVWDLHVQQVTDTIHEAIFDLRNLYLTFRTKIEPGCLKRVQEQDAKVIGKKVQDGALLSPPPGDKIFTVKTLWNDYRAKICPEVDFEEYLTAIRNGMASDDNEKQIALDPGPRFCALSKLGSQKIETENLTELVRETPEPGWETRTTPLPSDDIDLRVFILAAAPPDSPPGTPTPAENIASLLDETLKIYEASNRKNIFLELHPGGLRLHFNTVVSGGPMDIIIREFRLADDLSIKRLDSALAVINMALFERLRPPNEQPVDTATRDTWIHRLEVRFGMPPEALGNRVILAAGGTFARMSFRSIQGTTFTGVLLDVSIPVATWQDRLHELDREVLFNHTLVEPFSCWVESDGTLFLGFKREVVQENLSEVESWLVDLVELVQEVRQTLMERYPGGSVPNEADARDWLLRPGPSPIDLREQRRMWRYERETVTAKNLWTRGHDQKVLERALAVDDITVRGRLLLDIADNYLDRGLVEQAIKLWERLEDSTQRGQLMQKVLRGSSGDLDAGTVKALMDRWIDEQSKPGTEIATAATVRGILREVRRTLGESAILELYPAPKTPEDDGGHPVLRAEWLAWMAEEMQDRLREDSSRWETEVGRLRAGSGPAAFVSRLESALSLHEALRTIGWEEAAHAWADALHPAIETSKYSSYYASRLWPREKSSEPSESK